MPLNLNQLRVFNAICEELSMTAAARRLQISQPAVSKQLSELEQSIGTALVDRLPRGIRLTQAGELLKLHARRLFQAEEGAELALAELLGLSAGRLSVGASTTIGGYLVPPLLGEFSARFPKIVLELTIGNTEAIIQAVLEGELDLGLTEGLVTAEGVEHSVFAHDTMVAIVTAKHPQAGKRGLPVRELAALPWISRERGSGTRAVIEAALAARGVRVEPSMTLGSTEAIKNAVAAGLGCAMVSRKTVELELEIGRLVELDVDGLHVPRALHLVTLKGKQPSPAASEFMERLRAHYAV
ncbi:MAG TPA: LysR family transcriptional regulator [Polyangiaceae bacterium]|nr:LysR family transcriptional regulator [Polyangiaceae bacterium]